MDPTPAAAHANATRLRLKLRAARLATNLNYRLERLGARSFSLGKRAGEALDRAVERRLADGPVVLTDAMGIPMYVNRGTYETGVYLVRPYEPLTTKLFRKAVEPGAKVIDVGAQFGHFALIAAERAGPSGKVWALEPEPGNAELLKKNVALNDSCATVEILEVAAGDRAQTLKMFVYEGSDSHALHRCPDAVVREEIEVECIEVDSLTGGRCVDVIKIDVEGHEPYSIEGMRRTIENSARLVMITEYAPDYLRRAGCDPAEYLEQLKELGFEVKVIYEDEGRVGAFTHDALEGSGNRPNVNLLCTKGG